MWTYTYGYKPNTIGLPFFLFTEMHQVDMTIDIKEFDLNEVICTIFPHFQKVDARFVYICT